MADFDKDARRKSSFTFPTPSKEAGKKVLIVSSHPNVDKSFNHRLVQTAKETLEADGCAVVVNDLVAINFNPVGGPHDFVEVTNPDFFDYQLEQKNATLGKKYTPDLEHQMNLLSWCDVVIHQYPIYWWNLPAIHKGWIDRVLAYYYCYGGGSKHLQGKKWMCSVTTGGATEYQLSGVIPRKGYPPVPHMMISFAMATPQMINMDTLPMFVCGGPGKYGEEQKQILVDEYVNHLRVYVTGSLEALPEARLTASIDLTDVVQADMTGPKSDGGP
jgi:NAD(P)H dehydrogenase (quinone)